MEFGEFILAHDTDDLASLALSRSRFAAQVDDFDLALTTLEVRRKLRTKVPQWWAVPSLHYPFRLSGEQCSSAETARYKTAVALSALASPTTLADLTGGLGVDTWAFAQEFGEVLYNEMRPELAAAAEFNFLELGLRNVAVRSRELRPGTLTDILGDFRPDILFLDPARRSGDGRKMFRLEDCQPDVLQLLPELLSACPRVLLKLSPMADITLVCMQLGCVKQVHVVAAEGECKELLLLLERDCEGPYSLTVYESGSVATIAGERGDAPKPSLCDSLSSATPAAGTVLFEPGKALLKAGAFDWPCGFGLQKLGRHTHLYVGEAVPEALRPFGKCYQILEVLPLDKHSLKTVGQNYPQADVTARNIPLTSDQLRAKLQGKKPPSAASSRPVHVFGVHLDARQENLLLVCQKLVVAN